MKTNRTTIQLGLLAASFSFANLAHSAIVVDIFESGSDVRITVTGGVDISGLTVQGQTSLGGTNVLVSDAINTLQVTGVSGSNDGGTVFLGATPAFSPFTSGTVAIGNNTIPAISIRSDGGIFIAPTYNGASSTSVFSHVIPSASLSSLGITNNVTSSSSWNTVAGGDSITFRTGSAVPEPSSTLLLGLGATGLAFRRRRRG